MGRVTLGWRFKQQARDLLAEHRFDVLHFHEPFVPFLSPTVLDQSDTVNIATFHAFGGFSPSYWVGKWFAGRLNDKLHGRIAVSGAARHFISRYFPGDYRIIPNGVDLDRFADAEPFEELRDGTINILFVGRFEERKGLIHLLRAYHRLRKRHVDARLLIIGSGPKQREYRRFVGLRQIRDVEFLGRVSDDAKARYFASADIFCAPATGQESFGIVLLEAMAAGVPIVASDIHGYKNVVQRGVQGLLVEPRNHRALAAALYRLSSDAGPAPPDGRGGARQGPRVLLGPGHRADRRLLPRGPRAGDGHDRRRAPLERLAVDPLGSDDLEAARLVDPQRAHAGSRRRRRARRSSSPRRAGRAGSRPPARGRSPADARRGARRPS